MSDRTTVDASSKRQAAATLSPAPRVVFTVSSKDIPVHDAADRARLEAAAKNPSSTHDFPYIPVP
jgi:hypothetical protein